MVQVATFILYLTSHASPLRSSGTPDIRAQLAESIELMSLSAILARGLPDQHWQMDVVGHPNRLLIRPHMVRLWCLLVRLVHKLSIVEDVC